MSKRDHVSFCGGCGIFNYNPEKPACDDSYLNSIWRKCPCRNCLIKSCCSEECDMIVEYKHKILN